jgi:hypothetical protein
MYCMKCPVYYFNDNGDKHPGDCMLNEYITGSDGYKNYFMACLWCDELETFNNAIIVFVFSFLLIFTYKNKSKYR